MKKNWIYLLLGAGAAVAGMAGYRYLKEKAEENALFETKIMQTRKSAHDSGTEGADSRTEPPADTADGAAPASGQPAPGSSGPAEADAGHGDFAAQEGAPSSRKPIA